VTLPPSSPDSPDTHHAGPSPEALSLRRLDIGAALRGPHRSRSSHLLHELGDWSSKAAAGVSVACLLGAWFVVGVVTGFPSWWQVVLYSTTSAVTVVMVFAIQHTQRREQLVIQRKLDELVRAQPEADDRMIAAEAGTDAELDRLIDANEP
jgi:low affinity Fe/Cu permease